MSYPGGQGEQIPYWISLAPIGVLPSYFARLKECGARRVVALSSTSCFSKADSWDSSESKLARDLRAGENNLRKWGEQNGIEWVILRPTMIYSLGRDKNISEIARFINRFGFFPLCGPALGLRQPIPAEDVAATCRAALLEARAANMSYNISGGETLSYREMVRRVFVALCAEAALFAGATVVISACRGGIALAPAISQVVGGYGGANEPRPGL